MLRTKRWRLLFPMSSLDFLNLPNPSSCTMALESTQSLTEMSTWKLPGDKGRPERKADLIEPIVQIKWETRRLTTLWSAMACYRDSFAFFSIFHNLHLELIGLRSVRHKEEGYKLTARTLGSRV
jgi:hypothetical protein